jgi:hypothetical protein
MRREYLIWGTAASLAGATVGMLLWSRQMGDAKRDLFHRRAVNRLAALGYVGARPSVENARLLRDFTAWESRPALRRRAAALLRRMETHLG